MQMCPYCDKVYDESDYSHCPYCSGELDDDYDEDEIMTCPECGGVMRIEDTWICTNCGYEPDDDD